MISPAALAGNDRVIDAVLKLMRRRANLLGLDGPGMTRANPDLQTNRQ